ncbi:MAG: phosphoglycerate kinase [Pseudomonadota bacterium]|nr:phosphoglycerate kinase [Pseudomonadota bacterium]
MASFRTLDGVDVAGKRVLVRVDLNVPIHDGQVTDATRVDRILPTIRELSGRGARVVLLAHFDRPKGKVVPEMSLRPVAPALWQRLGRPVAFAADCIGPEAEGAVRRLGPGEVLLLENTRFHKGEEDNDPAFVDALAGLGEVFVSDAFSCSHRAHATTEGLAHRLPTYAGRCMQQELEALESALSNPSRPAAAVVGGAKVSTKLDVLNHLTEKVDLLVIGGAMANTFLLAEGVEVGRSLAEPDLLDTAREIRAAAERNNCRILLPVDGVIAERLSADVATATVKMGEVPADRMILDVGPATIQAINAALSGCRTVMWNGPLGAFETRPFDHATVSVAHAVASLTRSGTLKSFAGGGDTVAALNHAGVGDDFTYVSTAGGAFLEWIEGKTLPGVAALAV